MGELIYKDEAIAAISGLMKRGYMGQVALQNARIAIRMMTPVDAVPVVHGRWIYFNCVGCGRYQCSECLHWVDAGTDRNYCPNCGAKMDGGQFLPLLWVNNK